MQQTVVCYTTPYNAILLNDRYALTTVLSVNVQDVQRNETQIVNISVTMSRWQKFTIAIPFNSKSGIVFGFHATFESHTFSFFHSGRFNLTEETWWSHLFIFFRRNAYWSTFQILESFSSHAIRQLRFRNNAMPTNARYIGHSRCCAPSICRTAYIFA